jgi:hypothetical protein
MPTATGAVAAVVAAVALVQVARPGAELERVVGAYRMGDGALVRVLLLSGGLVVQDGGGPRLEVKATPSGRFEARDRTGAIELVFAGPRLRPATIELRTKAGARSGQRVEVPNATLVLYVGVYPLSDDLAMHVTLEGGRLVVQATGASRHPLFPESATRFFVQDYATDDLAELEFGRAADGRAFVIMRQAGAERTVHRR